MGLCIEGALYRRSFVSQELRIEGASYQSRGIVGEFADLLAQAVDCGSESLGRSGSLHDEQDLRDP
jgi:hypothetical protein